MHNVKGFIMIDAFHANIELLTNPITWIVLTVIIFICNYNKRKYE